MPKKTTNPVMGMDYPDPDIIFADGCFYMISTTMHFFPGGEILRSYDLVNWEHISFVFDKIESSSASRLEGNENIYGKGMWAASLRYHDSVFYVVFSCNDTGKTYLYRARSIEGPWTQSIIEGFYHDPSLLFDDDGRIYIVYGNKSVMLTELDKEMRGPLPGGLNKKILEDKGNDILGYEGSHIYKIQGRYYLFNIHSEKDRWHRVESLAVTDSLEKPFEVCDLEGLDLPDREDGVAQGGIVEGPPGVWHGFMFRDNGAAGRIPVITDAELKDGRFILKTSEIFSNTSLEKDHVYRSLTESDDFSSDSIKTCWQFNHEPDFKLIGYGKGTYSIKTDKISSGLCEAKNTLTQRVRIPYCAASVEVDGSGLYPGVFPGGRNAGGHHAPDGRRCGPCVTFFARKCA